MRLVDFILKRSYLGAELREGTWYVRVEMRDVLKHMRQRQLSIEEFNAGVAEAEALFLSCFKDIREAAPESMAFDEKPSVWWPNGGGWAVSAKGVLAGASEEEAKAIVAEMKERLMKADVYLRVDISL